MNDCLKRTRPLIRTLANLTRAVERPKNSHRLASNLAGREINLVHQLVGHQLVHVTQLNWVRLPPDCSSDCPSHPRTIDYRGQKSLQSRVLSSRVEKNMFGKINNKQLKATELDCQLPSRALPSIKFIKIIRQLLPLVA